MGKIQVRRAIQMSLENHSQTVPVPYKNDPRIESGPNIIRNDTVEGYEVNDLILTVD